jgi:hypothetical protein
MQETEAESLESNEVRPHPLSNDMAKARDLTPKAGPRDVQNEALPRSERRLAGPILVVGLLLAIVGVGIAAWLFSTTGLIVATIAFMVLIGFLFLWPVLAAGSARTVQDAQARGERT